MQTIEVTKVIQLPNERIRLRVTMCCDEITVLSTRIKVSLTMF